MKVSPHLSIGDILNCPKCDGDMKDQGESRLSGGSTFLTTKDHVVKMKVCEKCGYIELYLEGKTYF